jgi:hypothetical protein
LPSSVREDAADSSRISLTPAETLADAESIITVALSAATDATSLHLPKISFTLSSFAIVVPHPWKFDHFGNIR